MVSFGYLSVFDVFLWHGEKYVKTGVSSVVRLTSDYIVPETNSFDNSYKVKRLENLLELYNKSRLTKYSDLKLGDCFVDDGRGYIKFTGFAVHIESGDYYTVCSEKLVEKTQNVKEMLCKGLQQNS